MRELGNILITSAGRRVSLVKNFQVTLKQFNQKGKVFAIDLNPSLSSACQVADSCEVAPRVTDKNYILFLKKYCLRNKISIIVPTIDTELHILAEFKDEFLKNNILIAISSKKFCETFYLKSTTEKFFIDNGFNTPSNIKNLKNANYPLFAKLNNSSCSVGAEKVSSNKRALELLSKNKDYIFQEFIDGDEFTVDVFINSKEKILPIVPRKRLEVRAGEVSKALAIKDKIVIKKIKKLCSKLKGSYGTLTIQLFKTKSNKIIFIEINPRFGGGYPLSFKAGSNFAEYLIRDYLNQKQSYNNNWKNNTLMLRYDAEVIV